MTTRTSGEADGRLRLKEELDAVLMLLAERDMDARDRFAAEVERNELIRRRVTRIHRATGLGDPPAYKARASVVREIAEVAS
ncbi:MAG: hypothetical protein AB7I13_05910 [Vicinamibacterales bacterium]